MSEDQDTGGDQRDRQTTAPAGILVIALLGMLFHYTADAELSTTSRLDSRLLPAASKVPAVEPEPLPTLTLLVDAGVEPRRVRVQQQVLLTARVKSTGAAPSGRLYTPSILGARVLPLGEDRQVESADGGDMQVYEQRFAVFPTEPGTLSIPPLRFDAWRVMGGAPVTFESKALSVQVDPPVAPVGREAATDAENASSPWLPARELVLAEAGPSMVRIAPGQALERMITLKGDGVMAEDLPRIPLSIPFQLRIRDDAPRLWNERGANGVVGYRSERILIGAAEDGVYELPGASIDWWNTTTETWEQATLPAWTLTVAAFASAHRRPAATWNRTLPAPQDDQTGNSTATASTQDTDLLRALWAQAQPWRQAFLVVLALILIWVFARGRPRRLRRHQRQTPAAGEVAAKHKPAEPIKSVTGPSASAAESGAVPSSTQAKS